MLNLDGLRHPVWRITCYNPLSIWPSIHETRWGQECHFFVRNGRVTWISLTRLRPLSRQANMTSRTGNSFNPPDAYETAYKRTEAGRIS